MSQHFYNTVPHNIVIALDIKYFLSVVFSFRIITYKLIAHFNMFFFLRIFRSFFVTICQSTTGLCSTRKLEVTCTVLSTPCVSTFGQLYFRHKDAARDRKYVIQAKKTKPSIALKNCHSMSGYLFGRHCNWTLVEADRVSNL